jgi:hypothetical protein
MSELDPHLAALLRRAPPAPAALDEAHRQAVLAAARQAWFRQRARSRRNLLGLAAAAVFAAAIAGWTIRSLVDSPVQEAPPAVAAAERPHPAERKSLRRNDESAAMAKSTAGPSIAPPAPAAAPAPLAAAMEADGANAMLSEAGAADDRARRPGAAAPAAAMTPALPSAAAAMAADVATPPSPRGPLVVARLVLDAAHGSRLAPADRQAALQAALGGLAGIDGTEAEALRDALHKAMLQH